MSNLSAFPYIAEGSEATPGLWNAVYSVLSANLASINTDLVSGHFQQLSIGSTPPSYSTTAAVTIEVNSTQSDYLYLVDSAAQRSSYVIGSRAGGTADGLNIWDASGATMIVSFSKQSIRFFQNVVGAVFDVGGALANTLNAATFGTGADSKESRIQAAISAATTSKISRVYIPASMYPYSAASVVFSTDVQMTREGGNDSVYDVRAYGAAGNNIQNDQPAFMSAWTSVLSNGGTLFISQGTYRTTAPLVFSVTGSTPRACAVQGDAAGAVIQPSSSVTIGILLATDVNSDGITNRVYLRGLNVDGVNTANATGILIGQNTGNLSGGVTLEDVYVIRFAGASGRGVEVRNVVDVICNRLYAGRSGTNLYIKGTDVANALPTTVRFHDSQFREAGFSGSGPGRGVDVVQCFRGVWDHCLFESNRSEGFYCVPTAGTNNVVDCIISDSWFEDNHHGVSGNTALYHCKLDGTNAGTVMFRLQDHNYVGNTRAVYCKNAVSMVLDNLRSVSTTSQIFIDTGCTGTLLNWPNNNAPLSTVLVNNSPVAFGMIEALWNNTVSVDLASRDLWPSTMSAYNLGSARSGFKNLFLSAGLVSGTVSTSTITTTGPISTSLASAAVFNPADTTTWTKTYSLTNTQAAATGINSIIKMDGSGNVATGHGVVQNTGGTGDFVWAGYNGSAFTQYGRLLPTGMFQLGQVLTSASSAAVFDPTDTTKWTKFITIQNLQTPATGVSAMIKFEGAGNVGAGFGALQNPNATADFVWAAYNGAAYSQFARLHKDGFLLPDASSTTGALGFSSETSLGLFRSGNSTVALSYGTIDLTTGGAVTSIASLKVKSGTNNSCGTAVLGSNGSVNVANTYVKTGDLIFLTDQTPGGTLGDLEIGGIRNSSGFTIQSTSITDTSTVGWLIIRPG